MSDINSNSLNIIAAEINLSNGEVTPLNINGSNNSYNQQAPNYSTDGIGQNSQASELLYALEEIEQQLDQNTNNGYGTNSNGSNYGSSPYSGSSNLTNGVPNNFGAAATNLLNQDSGMNNMQNGLFGTGSNYNPDMSGFTPSYEGGYTPSYGSSSGYGTGNGNDLGNELLQELSQLENQNSNNGGGYGNNYGGNNYGGNNYGGGYGSQSSNPTELFNNLIQALEEGVDGSGSGNNGNCNSGNMGGGNYSQPNSGWNGNNGNSGWNGNNGNSGWNGNNGNSGWNGNNGNSGWNGNSGNSGWNGNSGNSGWNGNNNNNNNEALVIAAFPNNGSNSSQGNCNNNPDNKVTDANNGFTVSSTGDPHITDNVNGQSQTTTKATNTPDLLNVNNTVGGSTHIGTKEGAVTNGVSYNTQVNVDHNGANPWAVQVNHGSDGSATVNVDDSNGMHALSSGQSFTEGDGAQITNNGNGATITQQTKSGGSVTSNIVNQTNGLDLTTTGTGNAYLSGFAVNQPASGS